ncbi:MAG: prepilin-type N-terminal cleavage/methylation domain-containing protein [Magnetococcales bacterium]|nr:prepilin-type N-terminal cleavage/methylation domain-containing protein [Magnetococcales bacterium]
MLANLPIFTYKNPVAKPGDKIAKHCCQCGFTLVELMISGTLALLLGLALFKIVVLSQHMAQLMITQTTINSEARAVFDLLGEGGVIAGGSTSDSDDRIPGYHGRNSDPFIAPDQQLTRMNVDDTVETFRLRLGPDANPIYTREALSKTIECEADDDRVVSCDAIAESKTIDGYIDAFDSSSDRQVSSRTVEVTFTIIDPYRVPNDDSQVNFIQNEYSSSFWTIMTHIKD